jgi:hypothetical protein
VSQAEKEYRDQSWHVQAAQNEDSGYVTEIEEDITANGHGVCGIHTRPLVCVKSIHSLHFFGVIIPAF